MKTVSYNRHHIFLTAVVAVLLLVTASLATAQGRGKSRCDTGRQGFRGDGNRIEMLAQRLDLSEEQQEKIELIREKNQAQMMEKRKELMRLRNDFEGEMMKDSPSEKSLLQLNEEMGGIKTEMKAMRLKTRLAVREELTPEQRDKMLLMGDRQGKGHKGGRRGHGARDGSGRGGWGVGKTDCPKIEQ